MEFQEALQKALAKNNGKLSLQQATDLLPASVQHRVMQYLSASRNAGICHLTVKRVGNEIVVSITAPQVAKLVGGEQ